MGASTKTSIKSSPIERLTWSRASLNGEMAETITPTPLRVSRSATKPMRRTFMSLSSLLKLRPLLRLVRTMSPSRTSTLPNLSLNSLSTISAMVVFPAPERPVNHSVNPRPCLAPFCIVILLVAYVLILQPAGVRDHSRLLPPAVDEEHDGHETREHRRRVLALEEHHPHLA